MILGIDASQANRKQRSGTEWYAFHLIQEFKKILGGRGDVRVRLYTRDPLQPDLAANLPENFEVKILRWGLPYFWVQGRLSLEMLFNPPDILFCPAHTIPYPLSFSPFAWGRRCKVFTTLHDVGFEDYPELYDKLSLWYHRFSAKLAVKKAYHIFTVSQFSKERIMEVYGYPKDKITVTYLGVEKSQITSPTFHIPHSTFYILFLGRIEPKKNIENMIKGYEIASQARNDDFPDLVLAGPKIQIPQTNNPKIKFLGYIKEEEKPGLYRNSTIFLFPTLYEGFGLPILEAQSNGVPVITSNTGSNPEIAGDGALIVDPESPYEIAQAINKILSDENLREDLIKKGFENIKRFDWQKTAWTTLSKLKI